ncbi:hypothetical protein RB653_003190 [Dictyostelium firmibasis]|uniref:Uncharacterized protein n=1 Tax=Dictyostelium firmibasis TaxID=79012 RepID=A0AAN7TQ46_9MYCE
MSSKFKGGKGSNKKSTPFKIGGEVGDEQRQYFKDASKEIRNLGLKVVARRVKKSAAEDDLKSSGRKVKKTFLPFKKAIINHKIEKEKQDNLIAESILRGEKPILPKKSIKSLDKDDDEPGLKIGRFSKGTLHINKFDIKTVYSSKSKNNSGGRGGGSGGRGGRGGRGGGRGGRGGGRGGKR